MLVCLICGIQLMFCNTWKFNFIALTNLFFKCLGIDGEIAEFIEISILYTSDKLVLKCFVIKKYQI